MIPGGPIEIYLRELRTALPYPAPRLVHETRTHLLEATEEEVAGGRSLEEAERHAVERYGPPNEVALSVAEYGTAVMAPRAATALQVAALVLCLPTVLFVAVNAIEMLAGNDGGTGVFGETFDPWRDQINTLLVFGPLAALAFILATSLRVQRARGVPGLALTLDVRMSRRTVWTAAFVAIVAALVIGYGISENYSSWRAYQNGQWSCVSYGEGNICREGNIPPEMLP